MKRPPGPLLRLMEPSAARVFTIPPGAPFLEAFARALMDGVLVPGFSPSRDPLALARATIFVPTRRAARALATTLAAQARAPAILLPRILPLGALDAIETDLLFAEAEPDAPAAADLPEAIAPVARRMILMRLILEWAKAVRRAIVAVEADGTRTLHPHEELLVAASAADAWTLAGDLAALNDDLTLEGVDWSRVTPLGTDAFDHYWRITLDFLGIVMESWPKLLAERGEVDAAERQIALIDAEIARLARGGADGPVIVAGSTGSSPPTARLIDAIARLPQGAVVLPGLDQTLDAPGWAAIGADATTHPQAALKRLLGAIGIERADVRALGAVAVPLLRRARFVSEAMRPAATTEFWRPFTTSEQRLGLDGVDVIEAADERQEALALAIVLREALEGPGTAMLVTPDRTLGRRVQEELARWSIDIDASSGEPLGTTPAGTLARLVLDAAVQDLAPVEVLALLAHPLALFGRPRAEVAALARTLEIAILRGVLPPRALHDPAGLMTRVRATWARGRHVPEPLKRLTAQDFERLTAFLTDVTTALAPLHGLGRDTPLPAWLAAHGNVVETIATRPEGDSALTGLDGHALTGLFEALEAAPEAAITLDAPGYAALFDRFAAETPVRGPDRSHPRLKILGLLEARLLSADLVLLAGLDEGVWPPQSRTDAFLNRPMRASLGLPPPERRIGQTAHDLSMLMGNPRVVLSRAIKREGSPTVPSRFLLRMAALAGAAWTDGRRRGAAYAALATALDQPSTVRPVARPAPAPPLALRPAGLSVTRIETLRRDPYAIYAEAILRLVPAEPIGAAMGPREYGTLFHEAVAAFVHQFPDAAARRGAGAALLAATEALFAEAHVDPQFRAFVWPRIAAWVRAFLAWDSKRGLGGPDLLIEQRGRLVLTLSDGSPFTLTAQADRIEHREGLVTIVDYKTGGVPSIKEVKVGFAPQLTLEAAMVEQGAFPALAGMRVEGALYVKFEGKGETKLVPLTWPDRAFGDVVADHMAGLRSLLDAFRDPATGFMARPFPQFASRFNAYDHLARVKEWTAGGLGEEEV